MITDMNARVAMAQKLSIPQLQQAIKNGTIPAYVGVPMLQDKMRQQQQMQMVAAQQGQQGQQQQRPIADEVMDQAYEMSGGVDQLPSNLPIQNEEDDENYAGGGIIAFNDRGRVIDPARRSLSQDNIVTQLNERMGFQPFAGRTIYGRPEDVPKEVTTQDILKTIDAQNPADYENTAAQGAKNFIELAEEDKIASKRAADAELERIIAEKNRESARVAATGIPQEPTLPARPNIDSQYTVQDTEGGGITPLRSTPTATPSDGIANIPGAVSPDVARQISATNPGAPATLKDAERQAASGSPQASAAVSMLDRYVAMLEKSGDDVGRQKKEALYMALIQGGLGMMGGTSPNAFANISAGLLPATQAYQQAIAGIRKDDRARLEKLLSAGLKKEEFLLKAQEIGINQQKADNWYEVMSDRNKAMAGRGGGGDDNKKNTAYNLATNAYQQAVGKTDALIAKIKQDNSMYLDYTGKDPNILKKKNRVLSDIAEQNSKKDNLYTQYRGYVTDRLGIEVPDFSGAAPKSNAPAVGTVQQGYKFKGGDPKDPKSWEKV